MNKHAIRYAMLGRVRFDVHPGTFWPSQVRFAQGAFGRGYVLTRYHPADAVLLADKLVTHWRRLANEINAWKLKQSSDNKLSTDKVSFILSNKVSNVLWYGLITV